MTRPVLLDLFCGEGGAAQGYIDAGFDVIGVDIEKRFRRRYPGTFIQGDVLEVLAEEPHLRTFYSAVHASPPCQRHSQGTVAIDRGRYPDLIGATREALEATGLPWVIENVPRAPLYHPVRISWPMFHRPGSVLDDDGTPLTMLRERWFESNFYLQQPAAPEVPRDAQIAGSYGGARRDKVQAREVRRGGYVPAKHVQERLMGIDWMTEKGLHEAVPPVYTQWVGHHLRAYLLTVR